MEWVLSGRQRPSYAVGAPIPYIDDDIGLLNDLEKDIRSRQVIIRYMILLVLCPKIEIVWYKRADPSFVKFLNKGYS